MPPTLPSVSDVIHFWREAGPSKWFRKDEAFDTAFRNRFLAAHEAAVRGELSAWSTTADGALALLVLLDQFPRNAFRGTARMFATDAQARDVARAALAAGQDQQTDEALRNFFYLPFMHSEDPSDQDLAEELTRPLDPENHKFAVIHRDIIRKYGRFPHRNAVLGRATTPDEQQFLDDGGFAG
ncbi:MAG: DUF924 family protein [Ramlibacter sp.]|nr:DUF924 family protein [Ramlibacter sp.]